MDLHNITVSLPHDERGLELVIRSAHGFNRRAMEDFIAPVKAVFAETFLLGMTITAVELASTLHAALDRYKAATRRTPTPAMVEVLVRAIVGNSLEKKVIDAIVAATLHP